jgi:hypothetical protein
MGLIFGLHLIDPAVLARLDRAFAGGTLRNDDVAALYAERGRAPDALLAELRAPTVPAELAAPRPELLAAIFESLAPERSWNLEESLVHELRPIVKLVPELTPLRVIIGFRVDLPFPAPLGRRYGLAGFHGLWRSETLATCLPAVRAFPTPESLAAYQPAPMRGLMRLTRGDYKLRLALAAWREPDNWRHWRALSEAIEEAVERRWYLAWDAG